ncbi:hypothetical protein [Nocardioides jishulii]|uniref:hypothetical protein n=1 Tax=Nocardioides jishulii TaxID=2575440 RepID=UPI001C2FF4EF|nr:hypothetical protein [Nocardioides jishulii]
MAGLRVRCAERQHRAAPEVEDQALLLVVRGDAQRRQAGRAAGVLLEAHDFGAGAQGVADGRQPVEGQPAVEEVGHHASRDRGRLADGQVGDESRVGHGAPGHRQRHVLVEAELQAAADDRLVHGGAAAGQGDRGCVEEVSDGEVVEVRAFHEV